ncbi:MAG: hypothetical protein A2268_02080 [Candidatus Raymondbacteria bacterium RifOxyA12_full_50_37]|uniref:Glycosyltransferase RgtA/B/C/D-like domain-containing protein n=1 Tax=Candidatus Raymondbacteria bacterium RIFOXYD12_FULL_49_13 TaxID=1817890 RepID=A0A1F7F4L1_UNCRA|nr:MAG: hypothetical protein A2268_02080 [Candidatus Raymondbacteria bacterium RifOxyA12_full_50_37]OGJ91303.1 MAG: hypothetical protein A2350_13255 [Candidatus Raymondbacteria bacterium RifOxyB12_full_50_8]OGJ92216.1 MAG: hypothetical protein A2248_10910 [Candidatus Raymondbacteria bacterium RIFOXYA2_FULL_49_16]OGJ98542.1 MAG: hypothetical protein A2453_06710 [Candidatus Raymondbacteria bacterium RIFOXYC2_FULL_50_21]OGK01599.1 MAG: hypothetical protein A2519_06020 [Candidatus Raymondbacteria b
MRYVHKIPESTVLIPFCIFLAFGILLSRDYGISFDEPQSRQVGLISFNYIFHHDQSLLHFYDRDYGTGFELPLVMLEKVFHVRDSRGIYLLRHCSTFLLFFFSTIFFYFICRYTFQSWRLAILGWTFLVFSPRIFAHSFYNSKDIACLALFIMAFWSMILYLEKENLRTAIFHAFFCAVLVDTRLSGVLIPVLTFFGISANVFLSRNQAKSAKRSVLFFCIYGGVLSLLIYIFWPYLWEAPLRNFYRAFVNMAHFRWDGTMLYLGTYVNSSKLPWHYIPVWMSITIPIAYLVLFIPGCISLLRSFTRAKMAPKKVIIDGALFIWLIAPIAAAILLRSTLYDEWRHLFFVYPAFILISLKGVGLLISFADKLSYKRKVLTIIILVVLTISNMISTVVFMARYHPYQNMYFNGLARVLFSPMKTMFESDYWGLSYRQALEYILHTDQGQHIKVLVTSGSGLFNASIIPESERNRLCFVSDTAEASYAINNFRDRENNDETLFPNKVYSVSVAEETIISVYRLR